MSISGILSDLVLNTQVEELPASSYNAAKKMLLDTIGCAFAGINAGALIPCKLCKPPSKTGLYLIFTFSLIFRKVDLSF